MSTPTTGDLAETSGTEPPTIPPAPDYTSTTFAGTSADPSTATTMLPADPITLPAAQLGVVCLDAGGSAESTARCSAGFGAARSFVAGSLSDHSFVMALDPKWADDATYAASQLGLPVEPLQAPVLLGVDLSGLDARVVIVVGQTDPPCTLPTGC